VKAEAGDAVSSPRCYLRSRAGETSQGNRMTLDKRVDSDKWKKMRGEMLVSMQKF